MNRTVITLLGACTAVLILSLALWDRAGSDPIIGTWGCGSGITAPLGKGPDSLQQTETFTRDGRVIDEGRGDGGFVAHTEGTYLLQGHTLRISSNVAWVDLPGRARRSLPLVSSVESVTVTGEKAVIKDDQGNVTTMKRLH